MILLYMICWIFLISTLTNKKSDIYFFSMTLTVGTIYILNEVLSFGNHLNKTCLMTSYIILCTILLLCIFFRRKNIAIVPIQRLKTFSKDIIQRRWMVLFVVFIIVIFIAGLVTIPHTIDSMTYGMTRIAYWNQYESVAHYATNDVRAVSTPPLSEFINLQVYILHNQSDRLFTLLQTLSFITNTVLIGLICKKLKLSDRSVGIAILLFISMPIAFAEAFTTQVEQFATLWLLVFIYYILDFVRPDFLFAIRGPIIAKVALLSACIGLGYMTKSSIMFAMLVFAFWLLICCIKRKDKIKIVFPLILLAIVEISCILFPEIYRNFCTFDAFTAPSVGAKHMVDTFHPLYLFLNWAKNMSVNIPNIYFPWMGKVIVHGLYWLAFKWGIDLNADSIAHDGIEYMLYEPGTYECDAAVNPLVFFLSAAVFIWLILNRVSKKTDKEHTGYCIATIASFFLFCLMLKFEWYGVRYMLSYLSLACPMIACMFDTMEKRRKNSTIGATAILVFICVVELAGMFLYHGKVVAKHVFASDEMEGYFTFRENDEQAYRDLGEYLGQQDYENLGIYFSWRAGEYPIWKMVDPDVRIEPVNVQNETKMYADPAFVPDYIIVKDIKGSAIENYKGSHYNLEKVFDEKLYLYKKQS